MQKWEYRILDGWPNERELNKLGEEGWELVAVATISAPIGSKNAVYFYLKRPVSN